MQLDLASKINASQNVARDMWNFGNTNTPNAWDMCMQDSTCKGFAITGIVLGSLSVCWMILVFILCFCVGYSFVSSMRLGYGGRGRRNNQLITPHNFSNQHHNQALASHNFAHNQAMYNNNQAMFNSQAMDSNFTSSGMGQGAAGGPSTGNTGI